jgi:hypothetical protein
MAEFLAWLYLQIDNIEYFFGTLWANAVNVINNVWTWIILYYDLASLAIQNAVNSLYDTLNSYLANLTAQVIAWINYLYGQVVDYYHAAVSQAQSLVNNLHNTAQAWVSQARADLGWLIDVARSDAAAWIQGLRSDINGWIQDLEHGLTAVNDYIGSIRATLASLDLAKLTDLTGRMYADLVLFVADPAAFILGVIEPALFDWLAGILADWLS